MTGDFLKYRFPGESAIERKGKFSLLRNEELLTFRGFIIGDFNLTQVFGFQEMEIAPSRNDGSVRPEVMDRSNYIQIAEEYIKILQEGGLKKIILSRVLEHDFELEMDTFFKLLCNDYPQAFVYFVSSPLFGTWIGVTPERLLLSTGNEGLLVALAGTKLSNDASPWRKKEMEEQAYVSDYLQRALVKCDLHLRSKEGPHELIAGPVKHLCTELNFDFDSHWWNLVKEVHPTPAVCGIPKASTLEIIESTEPHHRELYCGIIGEVQMEKVDLYVNLRCAQLIGKKIYPYVGGGLTQLSDSQEEWQETENKAQTLLRYL